VQLLISDRSLKRCEETLAAKARVALCATCVAPVCCATLALFLVERVKPRATTGVRRLGTNWFDFNGACDLYVGAICSFHGFQGPSRSACASVAFYLLSVSNWVTYHVS